MQLWMLMLASSLRSTVIGLLTSSSSGVWNDGGECGGWQKGNRVADPARILPWIATSRKDKNNSQRSNCAGTAGGGVPSWEIHLPHMFSPLLLHRGYDIREAFIKRKKIFFFKFLKRVTPPRIGLWLNILIDGSENTKQGSLYEMCCSRSQTAMTRMTLTAVMWQSAVWMGCVRGLSGHLTYCTGAPPQSTTQSTSTTYNVLATAGTLCACCMWGGKGGIVGATTLTRHHRQMRRHQHHQLNMIFIFGTL